MKCSETGVAKYIFYCIIYFMYSFSANSKGEEALLHPQNSYLLVIQKKNEGVD